ncbi:MAG: ABC transporter ATP-binding protein [Methanomassiliicoccus sp.]|nr:ABC transporter ATP-binding protein [Methanomassiliicoccus sp.]
MSSNGRSEVVVEDLIKEYQPALGNARKADPVRAVNGISFRIERGQIYGLLGPNGAGKTTTIKVISTLLTPTSGNVSLFGMDVVNDYREIRERINLVSGGERGLYYRVSGRQNLRFFADLYRLPRATRDLRVDELLNRVGLERSADKKVEEYSRGMKQRLHIARGLINDPDVLLLDEPTIGLDPEIAHEVRLLVDELRREGKTILLTTHYMREAEELCDSIGIISKGRMVGKGTVSELKDLIKDATVIEIVARDIPSRSVERVRQMDGIIDVSVRADQSQCIMRLRADHGDVNIPAIISRLDGCHIKRISNEEPTLEDAYLGLVRQVD